MTDIVIEIIEPLTKVETQVPYKIASFDIEASSSHGDFPLAKKDLEMAGMEVRKTMKVVNASDVQMEGYKGAKLQAIKPPVRSAKTPRGFRAGHKFEDEDDDLPPGWVAIKDKESGDFYYYNAAANLTQWEKPVVKAPPRKIQAPPRTAKTPKGFRKGAFQKSYNLF